MSLYIIYDNNKGGYVNWSSNEKKDLVVDYALHYFDNYYYPKKLKFINKLVDFLDKSKDTIHSKELSAEFIDEKIYEFALGTNPPKYTKCLNFLSDNGFTVVKISKELDEKIDIKFGTTRKDVISISSLKEDNK